MSNNLSKYQDSNGKYACSYDDAQMGELIKTLNNVSSGIGELNRLHDRVIRYLLITVCFLALGKGVIEAKDVFWPKTVEREK